MVLERKYVEKWCENIYNFPKIAFFTAKNDKIDRYAVSL